MEEPGVPEDWLMTSSIPKPQPALQSSIEMQSSPSTSFVESDKKSEHWSLASETKNIFYKLKHGVLSTAHHPDFGETMAPITLLGLAYVPTGSDAPKNIGEVIKASPVYLETHFQHRFRSLFWVTYRSHFRQLRSSDNSPLYSDAGWGCTLRVGQMLLLETLGRAKHSYGRSDELALLLLIQENCPEAQFSIHSLLRTAAALKKHPGDWFSPVSVAYLLQLHTASHPLDQIQVLVQVDGTVYLDQLCSAATGLSLEHTHAHCYCSQHRPSLLEISEDSGLSDSYLSDPSSSADEYEDLEPAKKCCFCGKPLGQGWKQSVLLLVPLMFGLSSIQEEYFEGVKTILNFPQTVGIIGGRPRSAYYIVGHQGGNLVYLDPHYVQETCQRAEDLRPETYHCDQARLLPLTDTESSMAAGFFLQDEADFRDFVRRLERSKPIFRSVIHIQEVSPGANEIEDSSNCVFVESQEPDYLHV